MSDTRVGEEPFKIVLPDCHEVAEGHCQDGEDCEDLIPFESRKGCPRSKCKAAGRRVEERHFEKPDHHRKARSLRGDREEGSNGDWSPFINIRRPEVERNRRNLVAESRYGENTCD